MLSWLRCADRGFGYRTWQSFGRQVRQGEKGIMILAPIFRKRTETADESNTTDEARKVAGFRAVYVWDEQQTTGKELPQIGSVTGDPSFYLARLEEFVRASGIRLVYSADIGPARGIAEKGKITLLCDQTPAETFATLVHELAHSDMHFGERRAIPISASARRKRNPWLTLFARPSDLKPARLRRITMRRSAG